jgi:hypothetical protein
MAFRASAGKEGSVTLKGPQSGCYLKGSVT